MPPLLSSKDAADLLLSTIKLFSKLCTAVFLPVDVTFSNCVRVMAIFNVQ